MTEDKTKIKKPHNIILESRHLMSVSGVVDVDSFDENEITLFTEFGALSVTGDNLHINKINVDTGELQLEGEIISLAYSDRASKKAGGFFSRLVK